MAVERRSGGPVFGPLPMSFSEGFASAMAYARMSDDERKAFLLRETPARAPLDHRPPHPMLLAVRELMRREMDRVNVTEALSEQLDYMRALMDLHDALKDVEDPVGLMPIPGFHLRREDGGHAVYGWHFVLLASHGGKIRRQKFVSWHYFRWRARLAGNAWLKRARVVSQRIATELSSKIEVER